MLHEWTLQLPLLNVRRGFLTVHMSLSMQRASKTAVRGPMVNSQSSRLYRTHPLMVTPNLPQRSMDASMRMAPLQRRLFLQCPPSGHNQPA